MQPEQAAIISMHSGMIAIHFAGTAMWLITKPILTVIRGLLKLNVMMVMYSQRLLDNTRQMH
mgnify:CR=1 FL=1